MHHEKPTTKFEKLTFTVSRGYWVILSGISTLTLLVAAIVAIWAYFPATADKVTSPTIPAEVDISANEVNNLVGEIFATSKIGKEVEQESVPTTSPISTQREKAQLDSEYIELLDRFERSIGTSAWKGLFRKELEVTFNSFSSERNYDRLIIYDGPSTKFKEIAKLSGTSLSLPLTYKSSNKYGALTFRFITDGTGTRQGWEATARTVGIFTPPESNYNMRRGSRNVRVVKYRDPNGSRFYNNRLDVVETLIAVNTKSDIPSSLNNLFYSLDIAQNTTSQKATLNSLLQTLEIYKQPIRGKVLTLYLNRTWLGVGDFTRTIRLIAENVEAINYDDPADMTESWLNYINSENGNLEFIRFTKNFIPLFEPDSQPAVFGVVVDAFFEDFALDLEQLELASKKYSEIEDGIDSSLKTLPLLSTYKIFIEKEKLRQQKIYADQVEFNRALEEAENDRLMSQAEKDSYKLTSILIIGGSLSGIAVLGLILLLFAVLRTLRHIHSSLDSKN